MQEADNQAVAVKETELTLPRTLTEADAQKAVVNANSIDIKDSSFVVGYGSQTQGEVAKFADKILEETKTSELDEIGGQLLGVVNKSKELDVSGLNKKQNVFMSVLSSIPFIGKQFDKLNVFTQQFESVSTHIEKISDEMAGSKELLLKKIVLLDSFYAANEDEIRNLDYDIYSAKLARDNAVNTILVDLEAEYAKSNDMLLANEINDFKQSINRFEKKIDDLERTRISAIQTAPQIRIIQSNAETLAENIQTTINFAIPQWKKSFIIALAINEQKAANELQTTIQDATNQMMKDNADALGQASVDIAKANERGVIDIETLKHVQDTLIDTVDKVRAIQEDGKQARIDAGKEYEKMTTELSERLTSDIVPNAIESK